MNKIITTIEEIPVNKPFVQIWTDGSYKQHNGRGGYAALLYCNGETMLVFGDQYQTTINRMELTAIIRALSFLQVPCTIEIRADSAYAMNGTNTWVEAWTENGYINSKHKPVENRDLWEQIYTYKSKHDLIIRHVKSHTRRNDLHSQSNRLVDHFAVNGISSQ